VISSVSGGSFVAAYYALNGKAMFDSFEFETNFLRRDVQGALIWRLVNPLNWFRLASSTYDRIDMAAEYYDEILFDGATYGDIESRSAGLPFVILNATDMSTGAQFLFHQDQFDLLNSDLSSFKVARAVAASSAFPVLLSPLRLVNYPNDGSVELPYWAEKEIANKKEIDKEIANQEEKPKKKTREINPGLYRRARQAKSLWEMNAEGDKKVREYVHLLDGGLSDNLGLRMVDTLDADYSEFNVLGDQESLPDEEKLDRVVVIVVNAMTVGSTDWDRSAKAPGLIDMFTTATSVPIDTLTALASDGKLLKEYFDIREAADEMFGRPLGDGDKEPHKTQLHFVHLSIGDIACDRYRAQLNALPTSFRLSDEEVDLALSAGPRMLYHSPTFRKLLDELGIDRNSIEPAAWPDEAGGHDVGCPRGTASK
jgi:NTE family protein